MLKRSKAALLSKEYRALYRRIPSAKSSKDPKMSFSKLKTNDPYYAFPIAENMTRRLKKLA